VVTFQSGRKYEADVEFKLHVNEDLCTGCKVCEVICALTRFNVLNRSKSVIRVALPPLKGVVVCRQCEDPLCAKSCLAGAIRRSNGIVVVDYDKCTGCGLCVDGCVYGAMFWLREQGKPFKCDLCGGDPACLKACPVQALTLGGRFD